MHPLYTEMYFQRYLRFSIAIFGRQYPRGISYTEHEDWGKFLHFLKDAGVSRILTYEEMYIGDRATKYGHAPITENSTPEEKVRQKHRILEEIILATS